MHTSGSVEILVPKWGLDLGDVEIVRWLCSVGEDVVKGGAVCELETDKTVGEVEAPATGTLVEVLVDIGVRVEPGQVIGRIAIRDT
jgi:pyruvate/2-oxoglutarate dehydrogenase complex dihydrolipoamide acyltransferase (E2) component